MLPDDTNKRAKKSLKIKDLPSPNEKSETQTGSNTLHPEKKMPETKVPEKKTPEPREPETGGPPGPEPTRFGDWSIGGRTTDF